MNRIAILEGYRGLPFGSKKKSSSTLTPDVVDLVQRGQHPFMPMQVDDEDILGPIDDDIFHPDKAKARAAYNRKYKARVDALKKAGIKNKIIQKLKVLPPARFKMQKGRKVHPAAAKFITVPTYETDGEMVSLVNFPKRKRRSRAKTAVAPKTYKPRTKRKTKTGSKRRGGGGGGGGNASANFTACVQVCHRKFGRKKRKCPDNKFIRCLRKHKGKTNFRKRVKRCMGKGWNWKK